MAGIRENKRNGKVVSYRFTACLDRDANGKQVRKYKTWPVPDGLTPSKARKAAQRAADEWEQQERKEYQKELELGQAYILPPEKRRDSLLKFQMASYSNLDLIDFGVYITTAKAMQRFLAAQYGHNWEGSLNFEKVEKYLPYFKSAIQVPIYVIGIDV